MIMSFITGLVLGFFSLLILIQLSDVALISSKFSCTKYDAGNGYHDAICIKYEMKKNDHNTIQTK